MSVMDKLINAMKYNEDDDYYENDDVDEEEYYEDEQEPVKDPAPARAVAAAMAAAQDYEEDEEPAQPAPRSRRRAEREREREKESAPARRRAVQRAAAQQSGEVCIIKPTSVNDAREVTDTLLANCTVVLNLEGLDVDVAQRIIDFTSGSCYAVDGNVMKISHYIFVITPANIGVSGDISTRESLEGSTSSINAPFGR